MHLQHVSGSMDVPPMQSQQHEGPIHIPPRSRAPPTLVSGGGGSAAGLVRQVSICGQQQARAYGQRGDTDEQEHTHPDTAGNPCQPGKLVGV